VPQQRLDILQITNQKNQDKHPKDVGNDKGASRGFKQNEQKPRQGRQNNTADETRLFFRPVRDFYPYNFFPRFHRELLSNAPSALTCQTSIFKHIYSLP
jgi:hypothetical protein